MAITKFTEDVNNVSRLDDLPNDNGGEGYDHPLKAEELKAVFDKAGVDLKAFINSSLIPELEDAIDAAAKGISQSETLPGSSITNGSITEDKLSSLSGAEAVTTQNIRSYAVTQEKLSTSLQNLLSTHTNNIASLNTRDSQLTTAIDNLATSTTASITSINDNIASVNDAKQAKVIQRTAVLASGQTSWANVTVEGVTATNTVLIGYGANSFENWRNCGIHWTAQGEGTISFAASAAPSTDVNVNIFILP